MRSLALIAAAAPLCAGLVVTLDAAEAQGRRKPLRITVEGRSWLDAGRVLPPAAARRHAHHATFSAAPAFSSFGGRFGEDTLPPRLGAGRNPFGNRF